MTDTGGKRAEFWSSTLREIALDLEAVAARDDRDEQRRRWHTWFNAALPHMKKFPDLKDFIAPAQPAAARPPQTMEEQIAIARKWSAALSGKRP